MATAFNPTFKAGVPEVLFRLTLPETTPGDPSRYGVTANGKRFLVLTTDSRMPPEDAPVHVILNWNGGRMERQR